MALEARAGPLYLAVRCVPCLGYGQLGPPLHGSAGPRCVRILLRPPSRPGDRHHARETQSLVDMFIISTSKPLPRFSGSDMALNVPHLTRHTAVQAYKTGGRALRNNCEKHVDTFYFLWGSKSMQDSVALLFIATRSNLG